MLTTGRCLLTTCVLISLGGGEVLLWSYDFFTPSYGLKNCPIFFQGVGFCF